jgi:hypothetical protein
MKNIVLRNKINEINSNKIIKENKYTYIIINNKFQNMDEFYFIFFLGSGKKII